MGRSACPTCGLPCWEDASPQEREAEPPRFCSPLRCSAWAVIGRATKPHPITGARTMLRVVGATEDDLTSRGQNDA